MSTLALMLVLVCQAPERPNVLFILTEDQGAHLSFLGTPGLETPHMDSLARAGVYFRNAFVAYPVCSASKASIYTGLFGHTNGILNNTLNLHKPASEVTAEERKRPLFSRNRIREGIPTLIERLHDAGYYQGVTHKLHVLPNEKFPYDEYIRQSGKSSVAGFIRRATQAGKPWHLVYNIPNSHRPYPDSDRVSIRVRPDDVRLPAYLPDTPVVRKDWAEYLAAIEETDRFVGEAMAALRESGQESRTLVVFLGDHGPTFQHGKMTLYDLGLRTPLIVRAPWLEGGFPTDALSSAVDLAPTILDLLGLEPLPRSHGLSLRSILEQKPGATGHDLVFAEISHRGPLPNDGMQERCVLDGRWKLIYRERLEPPWRQVNADSKYWKTWGNRTYDETVRLKAEYPELFRILAEMDPESLGGKVPALELYDLGSDPDEMRNRAQDPSFRPELERLYRALREWVKTTEDPAVSPPAQPPG